MSRDDDCPDEGELIDGELVDIESLRADDELIKKINTMSDDELRNVLGGINATDDERLRLVRLLAAWRVDVNRPPLRVYGSAHHRAMRECDELIQRLAARRAEVAKLSPVERVDEPWHRRALRWYRRGLREVGLALRRMWPW